MFGASSFLIYMLAVATVSAVIIPTVAVLHDWKLARSMGAILANWLVGTVFVNITSVTDPWWFNIIIDAIAAWVILYHPAVRYQAALGVAYCVQIAMHVGYGAAKIDLFGTGAVADEWNYYNALTGVAWIQLLIVGGWCLDIWIGGRIRSRRRASDPTAASSLSASVEGPA